MPAGTFTLKFGEGDTRISIDALKDALENALDMLRNIGQDFTPVGAVVRWEVVGASLRSPLTLRFLPRIEGDGELTPVVTERITTACINGFKRLDKEATAPPHFNEDALLAAEKLVRGAQKDGNPVTLAFAKRRGVTPTVRALEHIRQVVEKARIYIDYGSLEGRLEEVSVHGNPHFTIWEAFTNHRIECNVTAQGLEEAKALLGQRVAVSGRIRYRNHKPTSIQVEGVRRLRSESELPQMEDMPPIDITGGLSSEEYVRRMRDAQ